MTTTAAVVAFLVLVLSLSGTLLRSPGISLFRCRLRRRKIRQRGEGVTGRCEHGRDVLRARGFFLFGFCVCRPVHTFERILVAAHVSFSGAGGGGEGGKCCSRNAF